MNVKLHLTFLQTIDTFDWMFHMYHIKSLTWHTSHSDEYNVPLHVVSYHFVSCCTISYLIISNCIASFCIVSCCIVSYCIVLYRIILNLKKHRVKMQNNEKSHLIRAHHIHTSKPPYMAAGSVALRFKLSHSASATLLHQFCMWRAPQSS